MNLRTLQYLIALADHQHFSRAAAACHVSQPTLSMQIKKLEDWLGLQLLERTNKSVNLTQVGEAIVERARVIVQEVDQLKVFAQVAKNPLAGECRLGMIHTVAPYLLPKLLPKMKTGLPDLSCYLIEGQTDALILQLSQGECDVIIAAMPIDHPQLASLPLYDEPFYLAVAADHVLANRESIHIDEIDGAEILLLKEGHCLREQALAVCHRAKLSIHERFQATSLETLRHMVGSGLGVTLMPSLARGKGNADSVRYIPFQKPIPTRTVGLFWRKTNARTALFDALAEVVQKAIRNAMPV